HDDGVVDDQTDGQHQRQQRQQIDRIAERQQDDEGADQRQRNGDGRYQRGTHRAEKQKYHEGNDGQGLGEAEDDLVDGGVDEFGGVINDFAVEPARQLRLDFRKHSVHAVDDVEQIGRRRDLDADIDGLLAVEADLGFIVLGAERDGGDVLQAHDGAVRLFDHEVAEFIG